MYLAKDLRLGRDAALRVLAPEFATDSGRVVRYEREAQRPAPASHISEEGRCAIIATWNGYGDSKFERHRG